MGKDRMLIQKINGFAIALRLKKKIDRPLDAAAFPTILYNSDSGSDPSENLSDQRTDYQQNTLCVL